MKKIFTYLFAIIMAVLVFYGGAGVNIVSFCCQDCRSAGIEVLMDDRCCEIHGHDHSKVSVASATGSFSHAHEMCCDLERVSFDWDYEKVSVESPQPVALELPDGGLLDHSIVSLPIVRERMTVIPTGPPLIPPRIYLSLLTTLLI